MSATEELLEITEEIEEKKAKLLEHKARRTVILEQFKELSLAPEQAEKEQKTLQEIIATQDIKLEKKIKDFTKKYPKLGE